MSDHPTLDELVCALRAFNKEREWERFHDPKNLAMLLASEAGELVALLRWVANTDSDAWAELTDNRTKLEHEIGDVAVALLLLCDRVGLSVEGAVAAKMRLNAAKYPIIERSRGIPDRP